MMTEQQIAQLFQLLRTQIPKAEIVGAERILSKVLDCVGLCFDALFLIVFMKGVDAEPTGN